MLKCPVNSTVLLSGFKSLQPEIAQTIICWRISVSSSFQYWLNFIYIQFNPFYFFPVFRRCSSSVQMTFWCVFLLFPIHFSKSLFVGEGVLLVCSLLVIKSFCVSYVQIILVVLFNPFFLCFYPTFLCRGLLPNFFCELYQTLFLVLFCFSCITRFSDSKLIYYINKLILMKRFLNYRCWFICYFIEHCDLFEFIRKWGEIVFKCLIDLCY